MDTTAWDGQENPRLPSSSSALDELFDKFFDWPAFSGAPQPIDESSHYPSPPFSDSPSSPISGYGYEHGGYSPSSPVHASQLSIRDLEAEFLRMRAPYDDPVHGSDYSGQTPPDLVQGGSTSPSDHSGSLPSDRSDDGHHRPRVSLREAQAHDDEWTYPQTESSVKPVPRGYPPRIHVHGDQPRAQYASQSAGQKRRRSAADSDKRQRQLADPVQTADVRKSGACLPCRVTKTRCHESGVCPTCRKSFPDHSHLVCTRKTPGSAWPIITQGPDVWSKDPYAEEQLCSCARRYFGTPREITIFLTTDLKSPALRAIVQPYKSNDDSDEAKKADFPRDHVPSHEALQRWVEGQIRREYNSADFPRALQSFLLAYSEGGRSLPKHDLVDNVHKMNCFFRIWRMPSFWCRDPANHIVTLPLSVQARLRKIAREALKLLEYKVLKSLDDCLGQHSQPQPQERMAIWACLWQLILMYRDLMGAFKAQIARAGPNGGVYHAHYQRLADVHFPMVAIFYHYQFRTKKSLEISLDWLQAGSHHRHDPKNKGDICHLGRRLLEARKDMYQSLRSSADDCDALLCVLVVNHELKKLNARKRAPKASGKSRGSRRGGGDDCDDDGE
ncbi:hypothetical protein JDV02_001524 [Purpureocillium takamizusanense]|uniref:Uncharacterized protein n=1 Tax=Purpureocillium takamizusanense TaxID=2060973 RepID=A0A9Q8Q9R4_9HYPO|nr:uncharacterized protein JDV02_001524 [Purpureocillium takamizusanense]UNI14947.1 hypothetical protein JDV02_001524 [Purpureocillium takamizusanense]